MPHAVDLPGCCGARVVTNLHGATEYSLREALRGYGTGTGLVATTIASERAGDALRANGFKAVGAFRSGSTGNRITIWVRAALPLKAIPGRARRPAAPAPAPRRRTTRRPRKTEE